MSQPKPIPINERALLTRKMAAAYLSISESRLDQYRLSGDIDAIKMGGRSVRFRRVELDELIEKIASGETHVDRMKEVGSSQ